MFTQTQDLKNYVWWSGWRCLCTTHEPTGVRAAAIITHKQYNKGWNAAELFGTLLHNLGLLIGYSFTLERLIATE